MKKFSIKTIALICCSAIILSLAGCSGTNNRSSGRKKAGNSKPEGTTETDQTYSSTVDSSDPTGSNPGSGNYIPTSDKLTYPDHVATYDEVHPKHAPGSLSGPDAIKELSAVETEILQHEINCYADADILFENPQKYGLNITDVSWGEFTTDEDYAKEKEFYSQRLQRLLNINYESLTGDDRICYDKLVYDIEESIYGYSYTSFEYYSMIFNYLVGPQSEILFILDVFSFDSVKDAENYILLIKDLDRYYDKMCEFEEKRAAYGFASSDNSYEEAAKSFDNLVKQKDDCFLYASFEERLDRIPGLSSADKTRLIQEHEKAMKEVAFPEFEECAARMRKLKGSGGVDAGLSAYKGGDAYFAALTRQITNNGATVQESVSALEARIKKVYTDYTTIATSGMDWYQEYTSHAYSKGDINKNLDFLRGQIKADFPSVPAHEYYMMDVPKVFEENFSPAAYLGYHLDNFNANLLIINHKSADTDKDFGVTVAHEAYPGHMFQSLYTRSHTSHPYMFLSASTGYLEGWATYVENYSMKYFTGKGVTDAMKLVQCESVLSLLLSTRVDYGIHVENWSLKQCVDYLNSFGFSATEASFGKFYTLLVTDPGYYAKYGMGYLWTQQTMEDMRAKYTNKSDKDIHTAYLESMTGPFNQIRDNMDKKLSA